MENFDCTFLFSNPVWQVYNGKTILLEEGNKLIVQAMRIGYEPSEIEYVQQ